MSFIKDEHHKKYCSDPLRVIAEPVMTLTQHINFSYKSVIDSSFEPSFLDKIVPATEMINFEINLPMNYTSIHPISLVGGNFESSFDLEWIYSNIVYMSKLPVEDKFTVYGYTRHGDTLVNAYLRGNDLDEVIKNKIRKRKYEDDEYMPLFFQIIKNLKEATKDYTITPMEIFAPNRTGLKEADFKRFVKSLKKESEKKSFENLYRFFIEDPYHYEPLNIFSRMFYAKCIKSFADDLSRIIKNSPPIKHTTIVYRGVKDKYYIDNAVNNTFKSSTFISTSYSPERAMSFTSTVFGQSTECCFKKIVLGPGTKCLFMEAITSVRNEFELLLNKDTEFAIIEDADKEYTVRMPHTYEGLCKNRYIERKHTTVMQVINKGDSLPKKQVPLKKVKIIFRE